MALLSLWPAVRGPIRPSRHRALRLQQLLGPSLPERLHAPPTRRRRAAWLLRRRLGEAAGSFEDFCATGFRPIPPRPAGMWRRTYARLADELRVLEGAGASPRSGRPKGMQERTYQVALDCMARSPDGGVIEAAVQNLSRERLALRRPARSGH